MDSRESQEKDTGQGQIPEENSTVSADGFSIVAKAGARLTEFEPAVSARDLATPRDPLDDFFYRDDEAACQLLETGLAIVPKREAIAPVELRREFLAFLLGVEEYGIEIGHVREIVKPPPITEVPRAGPHILGVITVRGEVIAVLDPRRRLNLQPGTPLSTSRVIVCDAGEGSCGLLVDMVSDVVRLAPSDIEQRPHGISSIDTDYVAGIGREEDRLIILLDTALLLRRKQSAPERTP